MTVRNTGRAQWIGSTEAFGGVSVGIHLYDAGGTLVDLEYARHPLPSAIAPGEEATVSFTLPPLPAGHHLLEFDCVANLVAWFAQTGSNVTRVHVDVR